MQVDLQKLKPFGVLVVLIIGVLTIVTLFTVDLGAPKPYAPEHDTEYYQQSIEHMAELLDEVRENVVPNVPGIVSCELSQDGTTVELRVERREYDKVKAVFNRDFGEGLFTFLVAEE